MAAPASCREGGFEPADAVTRAWGGPDEGSTVPIPVQNPGRFEGKVEGNGGDGGGVETVEADGCAGAAGGGPATDRRNGLGGAFRTMKTVGTQGKTFPGSIPSPHFPGSTLAGRTVFNS